MSTNLVELKDAAAQAGEHIYDEQLTSLGPEYLGQLVAIHIPTREYFIGETLVDAVSKLHRKHPNAAQGEVYTRRIGERGIINAHSPRVTARKS